MWRPAGWAGGTRARVGAHEDEIAGRRGRAEAGRRGGPGFDPRITSRSRDEDFAALLALIAAARARPRA